MIEVDPAKLMGHGGSDRLFQQYASERYCLLRSLLAPAEAVNWLSLIVGLPSRRVVVAGQCGDWEEIAISIENPIYQRLTELRFVDVIRSICGIEHSCLQNMCAWANHYRIGESISPHRDVGGTTQLLVALEIPPQENGGTLFVQTKKGEQALLLKAGDAVLFEATSLRHWTTPLVSSRENAEPQRVVAVFRYFFS